MQLVILSMMLLVIISPRMIVLNKRQLTSKIECLQKNNLTDQLFIIVSQDIKSPGTFYIDGNLTQINQKLGSKAHILFYPHYAPIKPVEQAIEKYATFLNNLTTKMVWLYVSFDQCQHLYNFTVGLSAKLNVQLGMFYDAEIWKTIFGSYEACPKFQSFPLYNYERPYLKFKPFGGWNKYNFSQNAWQINNTCGVTDANEVFLWVQPEPDPTPDPVPDQDTDWKVIMGIVLGVIVFSAIAFLLIRKYCCQKKKFPKGEAQKGNAGNCCGGCG